MPTMSVSSALIVMLVPSTSGGSFATSRVAWVSRLVGHVWLFYPIGSCPRPMPGGPAALKDVLSVPPVVRPVVAVAP